MTRANRSSPDFGIPDEHAERQRQRRDVRERLAGPDRERCQNGIDLPVEERRELARAPSRSSPRSGRSGSLPSRARGADRASRGSTCSADSASTRPRISASACCGRAAVQRANREARRLLAHEAADAHREELVQVLGEPRAKLKRSRSGRLGSAASSRTRSLKSSRGQLAVEEPLGPPRQRLSPCPRSSLARPCLERCRPPSVVLPACSPRRTECERTRAAAHGWSIFSRSLRTKTSTVRSRLVSRRPQIFWSSSSRVRRGPARGEGVQEPELGRRQRHVFAVDIGLKASRVDDELLDLDRLAALTSWARTPLRAATRTRATSSDIENGLTR